jgi:cysteinyl-tRNA synthetase
MAMRHLGETFDIHGGGMDLIFPHHENEIAQSCGATGKEFARYWVHNGFVQINQEKMSKSLGNFFTIREIFDKSEWPEDIAGEMLRYFLLATQYRGPLDFSDHAINEAKQTLNGFYDLFKRLEEKAESATADKDLPGVMKRCRMAFCEAMDDDFNTPVALAELQRMKSDVNKLLSQGISTKERKIVRDEFRSLGNNLGLFQLDKWQFAGKSRSGGIVVTPGVESLTLTTFAPTVIVGQVSPEIELSDVQIEQQIAERLDAKKKKNFPKADEIRQFLASRGIVIEDKPDGTSRWKR